MAASGRRHITAGYIPLLDGAILVAAREIGFAADEGIDLTLMRETSWANIRDRVAVGQFDLAHMLAPMPIAAALGLSPLEGRVIAPFALGLGGNAVTVSNALWRRMADAGAPADGDAAGVGKALSKVVADLPGDRLRFGVVHPFSGHNYELRYWLAASGIDPETAVEIVIIPPSLMPDALAAGRVDGYCVGEPWNSVAVMAGTGRIATVKASIWRSSPEKVVGVNADWAKANAETLTALLRALYRAAEWCGGSGNHGELARLLAAPGRLGTSQRAIAPALSGRLDFGGGTEVAIPDFFVPFAKAATFPWVSHALWFYSQMVRWGHARHSARGAALARASYRPDLYRDALEPLDVPIPSASAKVEGAFAVETPVGVTSGTLCLGPDGFFDGEVFDPDDLDAYIARYF